MNQDHLTNHSNKYYDIKYNCKEEVTTVNNRKHCHSSFNKDTDNYILYRLVRLPLLVQTSCGLVEIL